MCQASKQNQIIEHPKTQSFVDETFYMFSEADYSQLLMRSFTFSDYLLFFLFETAGDNE